MRNRMYGGVRGRKTKVGEKLLRFPPTRLSQNPAEEKYSSIKNVSPEDFAAWRNVEQRNQRFLINIIPIIGNIDVTKAKFDNIKQ